MAQVPLSDVAYGVVMQTHVTLEGLSRQLAPLPDANRRAMLRQFIDYNRSLLLRLLTLVRWLRSQRELASTCEENEVRFRRQREELRRAADELYYLHQGLWPACVPAYDVRAAIDVLCSGTYSQLPRAIALGGEETGEGAARQRSAALRWLRNAMRLRRCAWRLPPGMDVSDASGCIICRVAGQYEIALCADLQRGGSPDEAPLRIIRLRPLVGGGGGGGGKAGRGGSHTWARARQAAQKILASSPAEPLVSIHPGLHTTSCRVALEALHAQAGALARDGGGQWANNLRAERTAEDSTGVAGLRLTVGWSSGVGLEPGAPRRVSVVVVPGEASGMRVCHEPPLGASSTASRLVALASLDVEQILLDALRERAAHALHELSGGSGGGGARGARIDDAGPLPVLHVSDDGGGALAISQGDGGKLVCLGSRAARRFFDPAAADPVGAMRLAGPLAQLEREALARGVALLPCAPPPRAAAAAAASTAQDAASPATGATLGVVAACWMPLPSMAGWKVEVCTQGPAAPDEGSACTSTRAEDTFSCGVARRDVASRGGRAAAAGLNGGAGAATASAAAPAADATAAAAAAGASRWPLRVVTHPGGAVSTTIPASEAGSYLPAVLAAASKIAAMETLYQAAASVPGLGCEKVGDGGGGTPDTLRFAALPASHLCTPPVAAKLQRESDVPREPPMLRTLDDASWELRVPNLPPPPGVALRSELCSPSGGTVHFDSASGDAILTYPPPTEWSIHDALLDLQGIAMAHAVLRQLSALHAAGELPAFRIAEASCAAVGVYSGAREHVRRDARGVGGGGAGGGGAPPPCPWLLLRLVVDGATLASNHRDFLTLATAGSFTEIFRICDIGASGGADAS